MSSELELYLEVAKFVFWMYLMIKTLDFIFGFLFKAVFGKDKFD